MFYGKSSESEAAIHAMRDLFEEESETVLLVDAANAFNSINRNSFLHNINILCPTFAKYASNQGGKGGNCPPPSNNFNLNKFY